MRQLNDRPKSQTAKTSSEQVPYRSLGVQAQKLIRCTAPPPSPKVSDFSGTPIRASA